MKQRATQKITNYFITGTQKAFPDLVPEDDNENTQKRVCSLLVNADYLVHEVVECIKSLLEDLEDFTPTKLGITELAAYVSKQLKSHQKLTKMFFIIVRI